MNKIIIFFLLLFSSNLSIGQVKVQVFDADASKKDAKSRNYTMNDRNLVTFNTYMLGRGIFSMGYERVLHPKHSININAGMTYRDFIFELWHEQELKLVNRDSEVGKTSTSGSVGYMFDACYKFYPTSYDDFEGFYLSPGFSYKHYGFKDKFSQNSLDGSYTSTSNSKLAEVVQPVTYNMSELYLKFGYMYESWWLDDIIVDIYFGFGLRNVQMNSYYTKRVENDNILTGYSTYHYEIKPETKNLSFPCIYFGTKIGFPF